MMTIYLTEAYKAGDGDPFCAVAGSTLTDAVENTKRYCQDFAELQVVTTVLSIEEGAVHAEALAQIYNRDCWPALDDTWVMALQQPDDDPKFFAKEVSQAYYERLVSEEIPF